MKKVLLVLLAFMLVACTRSLSTPPVDPTPYADEAWQQEVPLATIEPTITVIMVQDGEFPLMCFDPLLSNVVILDIQSCDVYAAAPMPTPKVRNNDSVYEAPPVVQSTPIPPTAEPTKEPTSAPTMEPTVAPTQEPPTAEPEDVCKNKNSGKDGTPTECNAGKGQEKRD